ncbi:MAG: hypothetical protein IJB00_01330 [Akkermansia sp.]|nr:hypothetical protein [Akkermansia sp.]
MKRIEISIDSPAGRTVCALAELLNLDPQDVLQGILFGLCNRRHREQAGQRGCAPRDENTGKSTDANKPLQRT